MYIGASTQNTSIREFASVTYLFLGFKFHTIKKHYSERENINISCPVMEIYE